MILAIKEGEGGGKGVRITGRQDFINYVVQNRKIHQRGGPKALEQARKNLKVDVHKLRGRGKGGGVRKSYGRGLWRLGKKREDFQKPPDWRNQKAGGNVGGTWGVNKGKGCLSGAGKKKD